MGSRKFCTLALLMATIGLTSVCAHAAATLFLEEPYSVDGTFAGTGHAAVYLSRVCAETPVVLRRCAPGEQGVVISRYHGVEGYDWLAIPLTAYLYAVDSPEKVPLFVNAKLEEFLRERYRRTYLGSIVPDAENGETPDGPWYQLVGASYDRTIYAFEIETSEAKDDELIQFLNMRPNKGAYKLLSANCADFARQIINFYYPGALHRNIIGDLGVTTPKQIAKCLVRYSKHHHQLQYANFVIPQVPGTIKRSKNVRGIVESAFKAKKYMVPLLFWHPAIVGCFAAAYFTGGGFDPGKHALVLDPNGDSSPAMNAASRREFQGQVDILSHAISEDNPGADLAKWSHLESSSEPQLDEAGRPTMLVRVGDSALRVGLTRDNIVSASESTEIARNLLLARLHEELHRSSSKGSSAEVSRDLQLLEELRLEEYERQRVSSLDGWMGHASASKAP